MRATLDTPTINTMEEETSKLGILAVGIIILALIVGTGVYILSSFNSSLLTSSRNNADSFVYASALEINPGEGITSSSIQTYNQTWLDFDGVDDYVLIASTETSSVTFWYKNETSDWIFVANVSGTTYVDGSLGTPVQYPVYHNSTYYFIGMTDDSTYFNGSVDDFRVYNFGLDYNQVLEVYNLGR